MPDNKELPAEEDVQEETDEAVEEGGSGGLLKILLPLIVLALGGGGFLAYSQYPVLAEAAVSAGIDFSFADESAESAPIEYGEFTTIEDLLINPAGSGGKRFLVVSLGVESRSGSVIAELAQKEIVVRDAVLRLLSRRTADELGSIDLRAQIKDEILTELNGVLQKGEIERLYFTQYLLQ